MRGAAALLAAAAAGCGTAGGGWIGADVHLPLAAATVRVERVFDGASPRTRAADWLTGRRAEPDLIRPYGVAWDGTDLLVTDPGAGRVVRIGPGSRVAARRLGPPGGPLGIAVCAEGVVVTDPVRGTVTLLDRSLHPVRELARGLVRPSGVACTGGEVVVAETGRHHLLILAADGTTRTLGRRGSGPGEFNFPAAVATDGDTVWVGDTLNFRIQRIALDDGRAITVFGHLGDAPGELPRVKGIAVDGAGYLWVTEERLDQVILFRRDGQLLASLGGPGTDPGRFSFPAGIAAAADGRVAVVDSLNRRIQLLRLVTGGED